MTLTRLDSRINGVFSHRFDPSSDVYLVRPPVELVKEGRKRPEWAIDI
jgi:hypothetical protein